METPKDWNDAHRQGHSALEAADARWTALDESEHQSGDRPAKREQRPRLSFTLYGDIDHEPSKKWIVAGFFGEGELSCMFGAPGSGKSTLAGDLAAHVAAGRAWFGHRVEQGAVLYVAAERTALVKRRFAAFRKHHGLVDLPLAIVGGQVNLRNSHNDADLIVSYARRLLDERGIAVSFIVIETVSRVLAGGDENSPRDMGELVGNLSRIQEVTGAHVLVVHHIPADGTQRLRGHGALLAACDTTLRIEKSGKFRVGVVDKANDSAEGEHVAFGLEGVELHHDKDTGVTTTAPVVVPHEGVLPKKTQDRKQTDKQRLAVEALHSLIAQRGEKPPASFTLAAEVLVVPLNAWRDELYRRGVLDKKAKNPREDFKRLKIQLQARHLIAERDLLVWSVVQ